MSLSKKLLPMSQLANQVYEVEFDHLTRRGKARVIRHASIFSKARKQKEVSVEGISKAVYFEKNYYNQGEDVRVRPWLVPELFSVKLSELDCEKSDVLLAHEMQYPWADIELETLREKLYAEIGKFAKKHRIKPEAILDEIENIPAFPNFPKGTLIKGQLSRLLTRIKKAKDFIELGTSIRRMASNASLRKD